MNHPNVKKAFLVLLETSEKISAEIFKHILDDGLALASSCEAVIAVTVKDLDLPDGVEFCEKLGCIVIEHNCWGGVEACYLLEGCPFIERSTWYRDRVPISLAPPRSRRSIPFPIFLKPKEKSIEDALSEEIADKIHRGEPVGCIVSRNQGKAELILKILQKLAGKYIDDGDPVRAQIALMEAKKLGQNT